MSKLSYKYGMFLFSVLLLLQMVLFFSLYVSLTNSRGNQAVSELLARGSNYSQMASKLNSQHLDFITNLEQGYNTKVVITDHTKLQLLAQSVPVTQEMLNRIRESRGIITKSDTIVDKEWRYDGYLCTVSPIFTGNQLTGYIYMFQDTDYIQNIIFDTWKAFIPVIMISIVVTILSVFYLTRKLTDPILRMKEMTIKLLNTNRVYLVDNIKDKDEIGELEHYIHELARGLSELEKNRNEFLASISHELRTPLTYVKGYIQILNKRELTLEQRKHYLQIISEETTSLAKLIDDLFLLARIDENEFEIKKEKVALGPFFKSLQEKIEGILKGNGEIIINYREYIQFWSFDRIRMEQVILNLVQNALRYGKDQGKITIDIWSEKQKLNISVHNEGTAISKDIMEKMYRRFYRGEQSRSRETGGYGLGLSIVHEIVSKHGGSIEVSSTNTEGTTFTLTIPKADVI